VLLGVPALDRVLVALVQEHPCLAAALAVAADEHEPAAQLVPVDLRVQLSGLDRGAWVVGLHRLPGADVPHHDVAAAVLARGDHALEVEVLDRVVLDVHGEPPCRGVERRALGDRPADQHPVDLEPQVVVKPAGPVTLHDEAAGAGPVADTSPARRPWPHRSRWERAPCSVRIPSTDWG
jgi:hypothetical protein